MGLGVCSKEEEEVEDHEMKHSFQTYTCEVQVEEAGRQAGRPPLIRRGKPFIGPRLRRIRHLPLRHLRKFGGHVITLGHVIHQPRYKGICGFHARVRLSTAVGRMWCRAAPHVVRKR